jgi:hypothetical protein
MCIHYFFLDGILDMATGFIFYGDDVVMQV